jgi:hypothetical protein
MEYWLAGAAWITSGGCGRLGEGKLPRLGPGVPSVPDLREILNRPVSRYGRFDPFTRLGFMAVALTLKDAGWLEMPPAEPVGMVVSTVLDVLQTDFAYYRTTMQQGGLLSSPNLFSYTLPVAVLGECASNFRLTGPTYVMGDDGNTGWNALAEALSLMAAGEAGKMIAGWIESPPEQADLQNRPTPPSGAVFAALDASPRTDLPASRKMIFHNNEVAPAAGLRLDSLIDLLNATLETP